MDFAKIAGWLILVIGLSVIAWVLISSYNVFTQKSEVFEFFETPKEGISQGGSSGTEVQIQEAISEQIEGILPAESITQFLNLAIWSMLAFILIMGGAQIAGLGIKLIKN
ncbi:MAG: hypothetical protein ABH889_03440 [Candidatus Portnoybacteria bacterium]